MTDQRFTGGRLYDKGAYGCVFMPPLTCKPGTEFGFIDEKGIMIDKLIKTDNAVEELAIANRIRTIPLWKNYFLVATSICEPAPREQQTDRDLNKCDILKGDNINQYRLLRIEFGGKPLSQSNINLRGNGMYNFILHLIEGAAMLQLFGIVHRDLHQGNIVVDNSNVPRIIDFNLSINVRQPIGPEIQFNTINTKLFQEPPDSCIVNGIRLGMDGFVMIELFLKDRSSLRKIQALFGITSADIRNDIEDFYRRSKSAQTGDYVKWFKTYWATIDSWAIGMNIIYLLTDSMLWKSTRSDEYRGYEKKLLGVVKDMVQINPIKRIDCVQALARLDADNYIIRKYAKQWLEHRPA